MRAALYLLCGLLVACAVAPLPIERPTPLLLVSIDSFRPDYLERGLTPTLSAIAREGVRARWMQPSFPSQTFPNHYTLVTGKWPDHHGIVNNTMTDPAIPGVRFSSGNRGAVGDPRWWSQAVPLWVTAHEAGLRTATLFWPGSEAPNRGIRPDDWMKYDKQLSGVERVDKVLGWLQRPASTRPDFITLYLDTVDIVGHQFGPDSPQLDSALGDVDAVLERLFAGIRDSGMDGQINIVIVSDHGMAAVAPDHVIVLDDAVPADLIELQVAGVLTGVTPKPGWEAAVTQKLWASELPWQCWRKTDVPARLHYGSNPRIPALVCLANEGWTSATRDWLDKGNHLKRGAHGYDPQLASMRALFLATGPAFAHKRVIAPFGNVDVYPMLARLLGLAPLPGDGAIDLLERVAPDHNDGAVPPPDPS
ncbi:MAG: ectonucleotide pyrophosphatase/phosphodiesterase [Dokdonella sp.]